MVYNTPPLHKMMGLHITEEYIYHAPLQELHALVPFLLAIGTITIGATMYLSRKRARKGNSNHGQDCRKDEEKRTP